FTLIGSICFILGLDWQKTYFLKMVLFSSIWMRTNLLTYTKSAMKSLVSKMIWVLLCGTNAIQKAMLREFLHSTSIFYYLQRTKLHFLSTIRSLDLKRMLLLS